MNMPLSKKTPPKLLLASSSKYKSTLLKQILPDFETYSPDVDETAHINEGAKELVMRLSQEKAAAAQDKYPSHLIIGADQVAQIEEHGLNEAFLTKPHTSENAVSQLMACSGKTVIFYCGLSVVLKNRTITTCEQVNVKFKHLSKTQIQRYIDIEQPVDCAGSFKAEKLGISLFESITTRDPNSLVGLPLIAICEILQALEIDIYDYYPPYNKQKVN